MESRIFLAVPSLAALCIAILWSVAAAEPDQKMAPPDERAPAPPFADNAYPVGADAVRKMPPLVIMADDPHYLFYQQEYARNAPAPAPIITVDSAHTVDRIVVVAPPTLTPVKTNASQLFIFQNKTEVVEEGQSSIPLLDFRREQIEIIKASARKKSQ